MTTPIQFGTFSDICYDNTGLTYLSFLMSFVSLGFTAYYTFRSHTDRLAMKNICNILDNIVETYRKDESKDANEQDSEQNIDQDIDSVLNQYRRKIKPDALAEDDEIELEDLPPLVPAKSEQTERDEIEKMFEEEQKQKQEQIQEKVKQEPVKGTSKYVPFGFKDRPNLLIQNDGNRGGYVTLGALESTKQQRKEAFNEINKSKAIDLLLYFRGLEGMKYTDAIEEAKTRGYTLTVTKVNSDYIGPKSSDIGHGTLSVHIYDPTYQDYNAPGPHTKIMKVLEVGTCDGVFPPKKPYSLEPFQK